MEEYVRDEKNRNRRRFYEKMSILLNNSLDNIFKNLVENEVYAENYIDLITIYRDELNVEIIIFDSEQCEFYTLFILNKDEFLDCRLDFKTLIKLKNKCILSREKIFQGDNKPIINPIFNWIEEHESYKDLNVAIEMLGDV